MMITIRLIKNLQCSWEGGLPAYSSNSYCNLTVPVEHRQSLTVDGVMTPQRKPARCVSSFQP